MQAVTFLGGPSPAQWQVERVSAVVGDPLPAVAGLERIEGGGIAEAGSATWALRGFRSNDRYVDRVEKDRLIAIQPGLDRPQARWAALIPIKKSDGWWALAQDERRAIIEHDSHHISVGLEYLPAIARRLYHCRDLGEPFDFLTWFEFAEGDRARFEELVGRLRATEEWKYVVREVDLRLSRPALP